MQVHQVLVQNCTEYMYSCVLFGTRNLYKKKNWCRKACQTCKLFVQDNLYKFHKLCVSRA